MVIKPPNTIHSHYDDMISLFLAGSIEMGAAVNWQDRLTTDLTPSPVRILNPRRDDWDSSWE